MMKLISAENVQISKNLFLKFLLLLLMVCILQAVFPHPATDKKEDQVVFQEISADTFVNSLLLPTIEVMTGGNPTLSILEDRLGIQTAFDETYESYFVKKRNYLIEIESPKGGALLSAVYIHPNFDRLLTFGEVSSVLGAWKTIQESKTSIVLFKKGKATSVFVDLLDPPSFSASRVLSFTIRNLAPQREIGKRRGQ